MSRVFYDSHKLLINKFNLKTPLQHLALKPYYTSIPNQASLFLWITDASFRFVMNTFKNNNKLEVLHLVVSATFQLYLQGVCRLMPYCDITRFSPDLHEFRKSISGLKILFVERYIPRDWEEN